MKYKTLFRLALKAIGLLLVVEALPVTTYHVLVYAGTLLADTSPGFGFEVWGLSIVVPHAIQAAVGLYLFFGGKWVVNLAIPSNRTYCHECAYELRGLPAEGVCPECGTAYQIPAGQQQQPAPDD